MKRRKFSPFYSNNLSKNFNHTMNRVYDMLEEETYYEKQEEFLAMIISGYVGNSTTTPGFFDMLIGSLYEHETRAYKIRFYGKDKDYNSLPDPLNPNRTEQESINLISLHPWAYLEDSSISTPSEGDLVLVKLVDDVYIIESVVGADNSSASGRTRIPRSGYGRGRPNGRGARRDSRGALYENPSFDVDGNLVEDNDPSHPRPEQKRPGIPDYLNIEWEVLKKLGSSGVFQQLLDFIGSGEGLYTDINICGGSITSVRDDVTVSIYGKSITEMRIYTIHNTLQKLKAFDCGNATYRDGSLREVGPAFAVGKYQITPDPLRDAIKYISKIDTHAPFDQESQDAIAVYLMLTKRPTVGKYLLGYMSNSFQSQAKAQLHMAKEWASLRVLTRAYRTEKEPKMWIEPGMAYYCGVGTNKGCSPNHGKKNTLHKLLKETRAAVMASSDEYVTLIRKGGSDIRTSDPDSPPEELESTFPGESRLEDE